jgi:RNA recognition motif-containing protein
MKPDQICAVEYTNTWSNPDKDSTPDAKNEYQSNNLYIKHIPDQWTEEILRNKFKPFGTIKSMPLKRNKYG